MERLLRSLCALAGPPATRVLSQRLHTEPSGTARLVLAGVPLVLVAFPRRGATSGGTDLLPAVLHRASGASARPGDGAGEAELLLGHLLGPRRRAIETALARRVALDPCSAHRVLTAVVAKLLESLGDGTLGSRWDARELCREIGTALARGEDAVPGAIGTFEELLADGATEEDCVHLGAVLVGSLAAQACG